MALGYYPNPGTIVVCRYGDDVVEPEMRKTRPVVIIGPRLRRRGRLVAVVPLSTSPPDPPENYHCRIDLVQPLAAPFDNPTMWAKCDMVSSVSLDRLDRFKEPRGRYGGPRKWRTGSVSDAQLRAIRVAVLCGLGFGNLTNHL